MIGVFIEDFNQVQSLIDKVQVLSEEVYGDVTLCRATVGNSCDDFILISPGYGKVNMGIGAGLAIGKYNVDKFIGVGNCGSVSASGLIIGEIAISEKSLEYDVDFAPIGYPVPLIAGLGQAVYFADEGLIELAKTVCTDLSYTGSSANYGTADKFMASDKQSMETFKTFDVQCFDNECGCIGQVAYMNKIPYVYVKGVSNYGDNDSSQMYYKYRDMANDRACNVVLGMLKKLTCKCDTVCKSLCGSVDNVSAKCDKAGCNIDVSDYQEMNNSEIMDLLSIVKTVRLGVAENQQPYIVPMCFIGKSRCGDLIFNLYSKSFGHKMNCIRANQKVALEFDAKSTGCYFSVLASGVAKIDDTRISSECNDNMVTIKVKISTITGRKYYPCRETF